MNPYRTVPLLLALLSVLVLFAPSAAYAQDDDDELKPVPDDVLAAYLAAVKASPFYAVADAMRPDKAAALRQKWQTETGLDLEFETSSFLQLLTDYSTTIADDTRIFGLDIDRIESRDGLDRVVAILECEDDDGESSWSVPFGTLAAIDFQFVEAIFVVHPLNRLLARQSVEEMPLPMLLASLARLGESDYAINQTLAGDIRVSLDLRNRRISECLQLAAHVAGWKVLFVSADRLAEGVITHVPEDEVMDTEDMARAWQWREHLMLRHPDGGSIETPADAIRIALSDLARTVKNDRVVVTMVPADQAVDGEGGEDDEDD